MSDNLPPSEARPVVRRYTLSAQVADVIRDQILTGQLKSGERLVQSEWAKRFGISRMPVRDAINQLASEGIVRLTESGTAEVLSVNADDMRDGYALHALLSSFSAKLAATRRTDDELERLEQIQDEIEEAVAAGHLERASRLNWEFHSVVNEASRSPRLGALLAALAPSFPHATFELISDWPARASSHHREIIAALREGDAARASALVEEHMNEASEAMLAKIDLGDTAGS